MKTNDLSFIIVEPCLGSLGGHDLDYALSVCRSVKKFFPNIRQQIICGALDTPVKEIIVKEKIEFTEGFDSLPSGDEASPRVIFKQAWKDAWKNIHVFNKTKKSLLFFPSFSLYRAAFMSFVQLLKPLHKLRGIGIARFDPAIGNDQVIKKYDVLAHTRIGRILRKLGMHMLSLYTDTEILKSFYYEALGISVGLAPRVLPGVWPYLSQKKGIKKNIIPTVSFVGQPRPSRLFDLFYATALAMEKEREQESIRFKIIASKGSRERWYDSIYPYICDLSIKGIECSEKVMDDIDFAANIHNSDIVWGMGTAAGYRRQSSGIFDHAVLLKRAVIALKDSSMENEAKGSSQAKFSFPDTLSCVNTIREFLPILDKCHDMQLVNKWHKLHSPEAFEDFIKTAIETILKEKF